MANRQIVLDTETTGLDASKGHRIIEIGCVELINRRLTGKVYHQYIQPDREIDQGAYEVHGISNQFLADKPRFDDIKVEFLNFIEGAELVIHNAPFDVGFIDAELKRSAKKSKAKSITIAKICAVLDSLVLARNLHPGQKNNLDALCRRYFIDNTKRDKHGALLDAEILSDVYLALTGGQEDLLFSEDSKNAQFGTTKKRKINFTNVDAIPVIKAKPDELIEHQNRLQEINKISNNQCIWIEKE